MAATDAAWLPALATIGLLLAYETWTAVSRRTQPRVLARSAHASLREEWFAAVSRQGGSEVLAVQTLRNSLMSASMTASAAVLGLMGSITLAAPSLRAGFAVAGHLPQFTPRLVMELALLALLFASLASSAMAVRYYTHASFIGGMPVGSAARERWTPAGCAYVRKAGLLYSFSLRNLILIVPVVAFVVHPYAGPVAALLTLYALHLFDRTRHAPAEETPPPAGDSEA